MRPIKILSDSCCDLGKELREKYDIDYARMNTVYNDKETVADLDFKEYTPKELYDIMRQGERVKTTQVPAAEFERIFKKYAEEGYDIVYVQAVRLRTHRGSCRKASYGKDKRLHLLRRLLKRQYGRRRSDHQSRRVQRSGSLCGRSIQ